MEFLHNYIYTNCQAVKSSMKMIDMMRSVYTETLRTSVTFSGLSKEYLTPCLHVQFLKLPETQIN